VTSDVTLSAGQAAMIAGELADIIRQRLADYAPVTSGHQAVVLAYTHRVFAALELVARPGGVDVTAIRERLARVTDAARSAGFWVDLSVAELKP
jgi:hypothetical protein